MKGSGSRHVFVGTYDRSIDDNGRLALPAPFRGDLGTRCYATLDPIGCITIRKVEVFEALASDVIEEERGGHTTRSHRRTLATNSNLVSIDKQGRITLDEKLREFAGFEPGGNISVVGNLNTIEVWRPSRYVVVEGEDAVEQSIRIWQDET